MLQRLCKCKKLASSEAKRVKRRGLVQNLSRASSARTCLLLIFTAHRSHQPPEFAWQACDLDSDKTSAMQHTAQAWRISGAVPR